MTSFKPSVETEHTELSNKPTQSETWLKFRPDRLTGNFGKLFHYLLFSFAFGNGAHKQTIVGNGDAHTNVFTGPYLIVVTLQQKKEIQITVLNVLYQTQPDHHLRV